MRRCSQTTFGQRLGHVSVMSGDYCLIRAAYACTRAFLPDRRIPEKLRWSGGATGFFRRCCMQFALVCDMFVVWKRHFKYATNLLVPPPTCKSDFTPPPIFLLPPIPMSFACGSCKKVFPSAAAKNTGAFTKEERYTGLPNLP